MEFVIVVGFRVVQRVPTALNLPTASGQVHHRLLDSAAEVIYPTDI